MLTPSTQRAIRCVFCGSYNTTICADEAILQFLCQRRECHAQNTVVIKGDTITYSSDHNLTNVMIDKFVENPKPKTKKLVQYDGIRHLELD